MRLGVRKGASALARLPQRVARAVKPLRQRRGLVVRSVLSDRGLHYDASRLLIAGRLGEGNYGEVFYGVLQNEKDQDELIVLKRVKGWVEGAQEMHLMEHFLNVYASKHVKGNCADFIGYCQVYPGQPTKNGLLEGTWLLWRYEGARTLSYYLSLPDCLEVMGRDMGIPDYSVVATVTQQLLQDIASFHAAGLVHRDVKPANLVFSEVDRRFKLIDLGACADLRTGTNYVPDESITDPTYAPPEQFVLPTQSPPIAKQLGAVKPLLSAVLWMQHKPDLFDVYSVGLIALQLAVPSLRSPTAIRRFVKELALNDGDLDKWRSNCSIAEAEFDALDFRKGMGWDLVRSLLRPRPYEVLDSGHIKFTPAASSDGTLEPPPQRPCAADALKHFFFVQAREPRGDGPGIRPPPSEVSPPTPIASPVALQIVHGSIAKRAASPEPSREPVAAGMSTRASADGAAVATQAVLTPTLVDIAQRDNEPLQQQPQLASSSSPLQSALAQAQRARRATATSPAELLLTDTQSEEAAAMQRFVIACANHRPQSASVAVEEVAPAASTDVRTRDDRESDVAIVGMGGDGGSNNVWSRIDTMASMLKDKANSLSSLKDKFAEQQAQLQATLQDMRPPPLQINSDNNPLLSFNWVGSTRDPAQQLQQALRAGKKAFVQVMRVFKPRRATSASASVNATAQAAFEKHLEEVVPTSSVEFRDIEEQSQDDPRFVELQRDDRRRMYDSRVLKLLRQDAQQQVLADMEHAFRCSILELAPFIQTGASWDDVAPRVRASANYVLLSDDRQCELFNSIRDQILSGTAPREQPPTAEMSSAQSIWIARPGARSMLDTFSRPVPTDDSWYHAPSNDMLFEDSLAAANHAAESLNDVKKASNSAMNSVVADMDALSATMTLLSQLTKEQDALQKEYVDMFGKMRGMEDRLREVEHQILVARTQVWALQRSRMTMAQNTTAKTRATAAAQSSEKQ